MKTFLLFLIAAIASYLLSKLFDFLSSKVYQRGYEILGTIFSFLDLISSFASAFFVLCCVASLAFLAGGKL